MSKLLSPVHFDCCMMLEPECIGKATLLIHRVVSLILSFSSPSDRFDTELCWSP